MAHARPRHVPRHHYTADPHFGHAKVIQHSRRPFADVEAMDAALIAAYQAAVHPQDDLWIIGDFAWDEATARRVFPQIPGRKHLVRGNHDLHPWIARLSWASVHDVVEVRDSGQTFVLCHYPLLTWRGVRRGAHHLFGHVHQNWRGCDRSLNAGVDCWDHKPFQKQDALDRMATLPPNPLLPVLEPGT